MRNLLRRLHEDDSGAAMTEFVAFLPVWIFLFVGIVSLAEINMETTRAQLIASKQLWDQTIPITQYSNLSENALYMTQGANGEAVTKHGGVAGKEGNPHSGLDVAEAAVRTVSLDGHWSESWARIKPWEVASIAEVDPLERSPSDIIDDSNVYAHMIVNDQATEVASGGSIGEIIAAVVNATGVGHGINAGIRYGAIFSQVEDHSFEVSGGMTITTNVYYDVIVPPGAMVGAQTLIPIGTSRLYLETIDDYKVTMDFGDQDWGSGSAELPDEYQVDEDQLREDNEENAEEAEEEREEFCDEQDEDGNYINAGHPRC